jgi:rubredoxin
MPIENRNLEAGMRLAARYKGQTYGMEVVETEEGIGYRLDDGREFKSPSSAGSALMGGTACNGWRFWSLAEAVEQKAKSSKAKRKAKKSGQVRRWKCLHCGHIYRTEKSAAACRCSGAKAVRENTGKSNYEPVMVNPMNAAGEPATEPAE